MTSASSRTLMLQGNKEKFALSKDISLVIDLTSQSFKVIDSNLKTFNEMPLKRLVGMQFDPACLLYVNFKPTEKTRKLLGYTCRVYTGVKRSGPLMLTTTAC